MCAKRRYIRRPRIDEALLSDLESKSVRAAVKYIVRRCLQFLPAKERHIIQMFCFEQMDAKMVARKEKITEKYAKRRLIIAKMNLRDTIVVCIGMEKVEELLKKMRYRA
jgi:DNA-directed RNA polymerase specialized sigma24 family protein